jgi:hypothetical protein
VILGGGSVGIFDVGLASRAITMASECSCRTVLEKLAKEFLKEHTRVGLCSHHFHGEESTSEILKHMDKCEEVTQSSNNKLGDKIRGTNLITFQNLCDSIHNVKLLKNKDGNVIIPLSMSAVNLRFMIKYLIGKGNDQEKILFCDLDGHLKIPREDELSPPPKKRKSSASDC